MDDQKPQTPSTGKPYTLAPNVEAALSYVLGIISGAVVFILEKDNKFVRFHAMQSCIFSIATFGIGLVGPYIPVVGALVATLWSLASFAIWVLLMYKAYNNEEYQLPVIGKIARDQVYK